MRNEIQVVWFKRDLRISDHLPLFQAANHGLVVPLYIFEPTLWYQPDLSYRHFRYLKSTLWDLNQQLEVRGYKLIIRVGNAVDIFSELSAMNKISRVWSHEETWNLWTFTRDKAVKSWARENKVDWIETPNNGVIRNLSDRNGWSKRWYATMSADLIPTPNKIKTLKVRSDVIPEASHLKLSTEQACSSQTATKLAAIDTLNSFLHFRGNNYSYQMSSI